MIEITLYLTICRSAVDKEHRPLPRGGGCEHHHLLSVLRISNQVDGGAFA